MLVSTAGSLPNRLHFSALLPHLCALLWSTILIVDIAAGAAFHSLQSPSASQTDLKSLPLLSNGEHSLKGGETQPYRIALATGQFLYAEVEQEGIDLALALFGPDGSQIAITDSPNDRWGTEPVLLIADISGEYRIEVRSPNIKADSGRYRIEIAAQRQATPADKGHVSAQRVFEEAQRLRSQPNAASKRLAIEKYREAENLYRPAGDSYRLALVLQMMGAAYGQINEFRPAIKLFQEALSLAQAV